MTAVWSIDTEVADENDQLQFYMQPMQLAATISNSITTTNYFNQGTTITEPLSDIFGGGYSNFSFVSGNQSLFNAVMSDQRDVQQS